MAQDIIILCGPIRSGKTSRLADWCAGMAEIGGVLQPDGLGGRRFVDVATGAAVELEPVAPGDPEIAVGRFRFRAEAFAWANARLRGAAEAGKGLVAIDEIGPLELDGGGLRGGLTAVLERPRGTAVLVVRDAMVGRVIEHFGLDQARVIAAADWPHSGQMPTGVP